MSLEKWQWEAQGSLGRAPSAYLLPAGGKLPGRHRQHSSLHYSQQHQLPKSSHSPHCLPPQGS